MQDYMAPMEGVTNYIYRNAYHKFFYPMDKYFTPFLSAKPNKRLSDKEIREISPETNPGLPVIPQILGNQSDDFIETARLVMDYGHQEINLNLGCPSGTVTAKGKGAGFLGEPEKLDRFLDQIFSGLDIRISIKTRIGTHYEEDWEELLKIYQKYPIQELIIHPRLLKDYYQNHPRLETFEEAVKVCKMPLCYNGDLFTVDACETIARRFPTISSLMYGRGLIRNPFLVGMFREGRMPDKKVLRSFHEEVYHAYQEQVSGERNVLFRMKEFWSYQGALFADSEKLMKKIKKAQHLREYEAVVSALFAQCSLRV